jgi:arylsulfatase A-like enzyme
MKKNDPKINNAKNNILIIMVDQLRYDCLGFVGKYPVKTPNINKLAAGGMVFTHAFTTLPTCCPARESFLTGDLAEHIGALWNYDITLPVRSLTPDIETWSKNLSEKGYSSAYIGKWHCSPVYDPTFFGFERYYGELDYEKYIESKGFTEHLQSGWKGMCSSIPLEYARTHVLAKEAIQAIRDFEDRENPWLVCLEFPEPHLPCHPSEPFFSQYKPEDTVPWDGFDDDLADKPAMQRKQLENWDLTEYTWKEWAPNVAAYYGIITQMDDAIGNVLKELDMSGAAENTIIVFTSDHGDMCGSHGMLDKHYNMYDDVARVPLIMKLPGVIPENSVSREFVTHTLDVPKTLLEMLDIAPNQNMTGKSFFSWFEEAENKGGSLRQEMPAEDFPLPGKDNPVLQPIRDYVVVTYHGAQFGLYCQRMIRTKRYKFVWNPTDTNEFYDLEKDPGELHNCIGFPEYKEEVQKLSETLYTALVEQKDDIVKESWLSWQLTGVRKEITINPTV